MVTADVIAEVCDALPYLCIVKAVQVMGASAIASAKYFTEAADVILLDTRTVDRIGGTGVLHDWNIGAAIVAALDVQVILAPVV